MNRVFLPLVFLFLALAGLLVYQASNVETSRVLRPSELHASQHENHLRVRVGGRVSDLPIEYSVEPRIELRFSIRDPESTTTGDIPVVYYNSKPDMFAPGRDVIVNGDFKDGILWASSLMTQCPSKYEPPKPSAK